MLEDPAEYSLIAVAAVTVWLATAWLRRRCEMEAGPDSVWPRRVRHGGATRLLMVVYSACAG